MSRAAVDVWSRRLAHLSTDSINHMIRKGLVRGMEISGGPSPPNPCKPCLKGKQPRADISKTTRDHASTVLGRVFSDVCKVSTSSYRGYGYFVTWIDDKSRYVRVSGLRKKSILEVCHLFARLRNHLICLYPYKQREKEEKAELVYMSICYHHPLILLFHPIH